MIKKSIILLIPLFVFSFCKKEKKEPSAPATSSGGASVIDPNALYGTMDLTKRWTVHNGTFSSSSNIMATAVFTDSPFQDEMLNWPAGILAGEVIINGDPLEKYGLGSPDVQYENDNASGSLAAPFSWVITGSDSVPAFNYAPQSSFPTFSNVNAFPDTIHTNQNLILNLAGLTDYTAVYAEIGGFEAGKVTLTTTWPYDNKFTVSATDLQNNPPNQWQKSIRIWIHKKSYKSVNNKTYKFQNILYFEKDSIAFVP